jgi:hypothetical protein
VDPFGNFLAGPNMEGEAVLVAEIDCAQIVGGKYDLDVVGHYARPDIFQLHVDARAKQPVTIQDGELKEKEKEETSASPQRQALARSTD